jgi:hypothetical protein
MSHLLLALVLVVLAAAYFVHLARVIRMNRPTTPPRSHPHELDPVALRLTWP